MHCANFPRHLGRQITRCLVAHPDGADTIELAHWAHGEVLPRYARHNVRRHCLAFGIPRVGKFIWALLLQQLFAEFGVLHAVAEPQQRMVSYVTCSPTKIG